MKPIQIVVAMMLTLLSFSSCQEDPCDNKPCENGGVCNEGTCLCPEGYTGNQCEEKIMPYRMRISSVTLTRFPASNDGVIWDGTDGPDLFFKLYQDSLPIGKPLHLFMDAPIDQSYEFQINLIEMRNITQRHYMKLFDYEGFNLTPEFMGEVEFIPYNEENGLPETIVLDNGGPVAFVIGVTYLYPKETDLAGN